MTVYELIEELSRLPESRKAKQAMVSDDGLPRPIDTEDITTNDIVIYGAGVDCGVLL